MDQWTKHDLSSALSTVALRYAEERGSQFEGNSLARFVREDRAECARRAIMYRQEDLLVKGSAGQSTWAAVPWLAFFDPLITESAQRGFYVVYLINSGRREVHLSLNQGATAAKAEFGFQASLKVLARRAGDIRLRLHDFAKRFSDRPIKLDSANELPRGYEAGHVFGKTYQVDGSPLGDIASDLMSMLDAYGALIERGGLTPLDTMFEQSGVTDLEETKKYVLSRRVERSPKVRREVLKIKPLICEACGLDPSKTYGWKGKAISAPLDVHHAAPIGALREGHSRRYKVPDDFLVLCPTCHRMIHKQNDPSDLEALRHRIRRGGLF